MGRGMGWAPGKGVGKTNARVVEPVEYLKRPDGLGLGATPAAIPEKKKDKKFIKPGEKRGEKKEFYTTESGKSVRTLDEKLVKRKSAALEEGAEVIVTSGSHQGLTAKILKVSGNEVRIR